MQKEIALKLIEDAGFILWEDESWKPEDEVIDWSNNYDSEIFKLIELIENYYDKSEIIKN